MDEDIVREQVEYYRARAAEYDEWFFRQGRYDRGDAYRRDWFADVEIVEKALSTANVTGDVLELACGTGLWTRHLVPRSQTMTAIDAAPEAIALNQERVRSSFVDYVLADVFDWRPTKKFDFIFFAFWLSHVPARRFLSFLQLVRELLKSGGEVFFADSLFDQESTARNHAPLERTGIADRLLNDGRSFRTVKVFYEPSELEFRLRELGWHATVLSAGRYFLYGRARLPSGTP